MPDGKAVHAGADGRGPLVLALDASTYAGTVAVLRGGAVLAERVVAMRGADEERLMPAVADALAAAGVAPRALDAVVCGGGPGSFTSLRIAGAIAKGLTVAAGCPLFAVPSLALAAAGRAGVWLVAADAMRGERYAARVACDAAGAVVGYVYLGVHARDALAALADAHDATLLEVAGADGVAPHARGVAAFGLALPASGAEASGGPALVLAPVDLAAWEPDYGRKAEAQVQWEVRHGRALPADPMGGVHDAPSDTPTDAGAGAAA